MPVILCIIREISLPSEAPLPPLKLWNKSLFFAQSRSPKSHNVCPCQTYLEQSIFIILAQIFKQSVRNKSAVSKHSESTQRALRESESIKIRVNTVGA